MKVSLLAVFVAVGCVADPGVDEVDAAGLAASSCAGAARWAEDVAYATGAIVAYEGKAYRCRSGHTSLAGWTPAAVPALWEEASSCPESSGGGGSGQPGGAGQSGGASSGDGGACGFPSWTQGASYRAGDIVMYQGAAYIAEHDNPGYDPTISTWYWDPYSGCGGTGGAGGTGGGSGSAGDARGLAEILSEAVFDRMFPDRSPFYTYQALLSAAATFPEVATAGDATTRKREVAAFLANVAHETGNLVYTEEIARAPYCDESWGPPGCRCAPGKSYYGRGPIQLSWNGNYCSAGAALGLNLRDDPDLVARDATVAWRTGFWFWTTQTGAGTTTAHHAMVSGAGFGETIRTINGALECGGRNPAQVQSRVDSYTRFASLLGVTPGSDTGC